MTQSGEIVGNYEFLGIIERPKAGVTYKVRNLATGEFEVLRTLPGASYTDAESLERLLREMRVHTRISHPKVVAFHDVFELDGQLVMTAEYVEGTSVALLCRPGPLPSSQAVGIAIDVLSGLEEAHSLGIVHRGITADHVTVTPGGETKLGGFGLAKPAADVNLTKDGAVLGDAHYISPEQVMGTGPLDARSDIYSAGVLLFHMLTGRVPFDSPNDFDIMVAQVSKPTPRPSELNPGIAPELEQVVLTALAKKPEDRFQSAAEFRGALVAMTERAAVVPTANSNREALVETAAPRFLMQAEAGSSATKVMVMCAVGVLGIFVLALVLFHVL